MSFRAVFLIGAGGAMFHLSFLGTGILLIAYAGGAGLDRWLADRARRKAFDEAIDDEISGWEKEPDNADWETKGNLTRTKLPAKEQVVVTRVLTGVAELLKRNP